MREPTTRTADSQGTIWVCLALVNATMLKKEKELTDYLADSRRERGPCLTLNSYIYAAPEIGERLARAEFEAEGYHRQRAVAAIAAFEEAFRGYSEGDH